MLLKGIISIRIHETIMTFYFFVTPNETFEPTKWWAPVSIQQRNTREALKLLAVFFFFFFFCLKFFIMVLKVRLLQLEKLLFQDLLIDFIEITQSQKLESEIGSSRWILPFFKIKKFEHITKSPSNFIQSHTSWEEATSFIIMHAKLPQRTTTYSKSQFYIVFG